jgi:hypothetical protein
MFLGLPRINEDDERLFVPTKRRALMLAVIEDMLLFFAALMFSLNLFITMNRKRNEIKVPIFYCK